MKYLTLLIVIFSISGCDVLSGKKNESFSLFETSKGTVYLLNTKSGETKIIYSTESAPKLILHGTYESEDGKKYEYQGAGKLREMSEQEVVEKLLKKYGV